MADVTVVTLNVHGRTLDWCARRKLLVDQLAELAPDVVSLQELLTWPSQGAWLARALNDRIPAGAGVYRFLGARKRGLRAYESVGILSRLGVRQRDVIALGAGGRVALRARLALKDGALADLYALHLQHGGEAGATRLSAARRILTRAGEEGVPAIVAGDLNATPTSRTLEAFAAKFRSAHAAVHGHESERTAPVEPGKPGFALDYILVSAEFAVVEAAVAFERRDARGRTASDHFGIVARLRL